MPYGGGTPSELDDILPTIPGVAASRQPQAVATTPLAKKTTEAHSRERTDPKDQIVPQLVDKISNPLHLNPVRSKFSEDLSRDKTMHLR